MTRPKLRRLPATPVPPRRRTRHHWRTSGEGNIVLTVESEAPAWCCTRVDWPVLVAAAYVQTFGTEVLGPGAHFGK